MKVGGRIPWNATSICETFKISCLMGRHPTKRRSEYHLMDQLSRLEYWSNVTFISANILSIHHQFGPKVLPCFFFGYVLSAGRIWKRDIMVTDIEELEEMDASLPHSVMRLRLLRSGHRCAGKHYC